jgi:hypothetical protein
MNVTFDDMEVFKFKYIINIMPLRPFSLFMVQFPFLNYVNMVAVRLSDMRHPSF